MAPFSIKSKNLFLTYSQSKLDHVDIHTAICDRFSEHSYVCTSKEQHKDSGTHYHAYVKFEQPYRSRDCKFADISGEHPNAQAVRNPNATINYVQKDGDYLESGELSRDPNGRRGLGVGDGEGYMQYLERQHQEGIMAC